jgi:hypothetical protein
VAHGRLDGTDVVARQEAGMGVRAPQVGGRDALEHAGAQAGLLNNTFGLPDAQATRILDAQRGGLGV